MHDYNIVLCRSICPIGQWITAILGLKGELGSLVTDPTALGSSSASKKIAILGYIRAISGVCCPWLRTPGKETLLLSQAWGNDSRKVVNTLQKFEVQRSRNFIPPIFNSGLVSLLLSPIWYIQCTFETELARLRSPS